MTTCYHAMTMLYVYFLLSVGFVVGFLASGLFNTDDHERKD